MTKGVDKVTAWILRAIHTVVNGENDDRPFVRLPTSARHKEGWWKALWLQNRFGYRRPLRVEHFVWLWFGLLSPHRKESWYVYLLRCSDGSLYCGATTDLKRRVEEHNEGIVSRYTRARLPVRLMWSSPAMGKSAAYREE